MGEVVEKAIQDLRGKFMLDKELRASLRNALTPPRSDLPLPLRTKEFGGKVMLDKKLRTSSRNVPTLTRVTLALNAKEPQTSADAEMEPGGEVQICNNGTDALGETTVTIRAVPTIGRTST